MVSDEHVVKVDAIVHRYGDRVALNGVSFDVPRGSLFGLLGPNGSGKTTLFRILATLLEPTGGTARIDGADVRRDGAVVRRRIGVVFQNPSLDPLLTVEENLRYQGYLYGMRGRSLTRRIEELLTRFGVLDRLRDRAGVLSGGLQRRVEIAKALLHDPPVLLLDEPSTGLDPGSRRALTDLLHELRDQRGVTSLLTTHLMEEADRCDRLALLDGGRLVALDTPDALKERIGGDVVTVAAVDADHLADRIRQRFGIVPERLSGELRIERDRGHTFVPELIEAFPGEIRSVTVGRPTLEDVFVHLTGHHMHREAGENERAART
ncbi:MAG: ABC transporter ATP-binding protein [Planctomycetota bacterium]|nr:MAG: ABC transporter ATP-binding protein [Planctomycetota bacterium]